MINARVPNGWKGALRCAFLLLVIAAAHPLAAQSIRLLHFSDYHSHALPFYSEGRSDQGGLARAMAFLKREHRRGALVFSGGDMMNRGAPAWSDKYRCHEWPWFNGVVDAMAFGNHDADYGAQVFADCQKAIRFPIVSANVLHANGKPLFVPWRVFERKGIRIGVFAVAGSDFPALVRKEIMPAPEVRFGDAVEAARSVVGRLRNVEHVDAVVLIGHQHSGDDFALARRVPGIDVIFGTHSHRKQELIRIPGTATWFLAPFQYLTYISRVDLVFERGKLKDVRGGLVRLDAAMRGDATMAARISRMQRELEADPAYRDLFVPIAETTAALEIDGHLSADASLPNLVLDVAREATAADVAVTTASSFRQAVAPGPITTSTLIDALPYDNAIALYEMTGERLRDLMLRSGRRMGTDDFLQVSGMRIVFGKDGSIRKIEVGGDALRDDRRYRVATSDYVARVAASYRDLFSSISGENSGLRFREELRRQLVARTPMRYERDGRIALDMP